MITSEDLSRIAWYDIEIGIAYKLSTGVVGSDLKESFEFTSLQYLNAIPPSCRLDVVIQCDHTHFSRHGKSGTRMLLWQPHVYRGFDTEIVEKLSEPKVVNIMYDWWGRFSLDFITSRYSVSVLPFIASETPDNSMYYEKLNSISNPLERKKFAQKHKQEQMNFLKQPRLDRRYK